MGRYPTHQQVQEIFAHRGEPDVFNPHFVADLDAVVVGHDFILGGSYAGIDAFTEGMFGRVAPWLKMDTVRIEVTRVIGADENGWAAVESTGKGTTIYGIVVSFFFPFFLSLSFLFFSLSFFFALSFFSFILSFFTLSSSLFFPFSF